MSLWTPGGEHPVDPPSSEPSPNDPPAPELPHDLSEADQEHLEAMQAEMDQVREQLLAAPASVVIANHAMGIYELAAIHLTAPEPNLQEAVLAIDALSALTEGLAGRLGEAEPTITEALAQLKGAYLDVRSRIGEPGV